MTDAKRITSLSAAILLAAQLFTPFIPAAYADDKKGQNTTSIATSETAKLGYIACSLFGDLANFDDYEGKIGITDGNSTRYFFFTKKNCDTEILQALTAMLNVLYTSSEEMLLSESGYTFESLSLNQRFDTIARYIEANLEVCLLMLAHIPYMEWK